MSHNLYGTVKTNVYNYTDFKKPLLLKQSDYRTAYTRGVQNIRPIGEPSDIGHRVNIPDSLTKGNVLVRDETYNNNDYAYKSGNTYYAEKYYRAANIKNVRSMRILKEKLFAKPPRPLSFTVSEAKAQFQHKADDSIPFRLNFKPEPNAKCPVKALGRDELPAYRPETRNYTKWLDPYVSVTRGTFVPFTRDQQCGVACKDIITFYDAAKFPKAKGFGPKKIPLFEPLLSRRRTPIYDKIFFRKFVSDRILPQKIPRVPHSGIKTEYAANYVRLDTFPIWTELFKPAFEYPDALPKASVYQNQAAPGMYETDFSHIGTGWPVRAVVDQDTDKIGPFIRKQCCIRVN